MRKVLVIFLIIISFYSSAQVADKVTSIQDQNIATIETKDPCSEIDRIMNASFVCDSSYNGCQIDSIFYGNQWYLTVKIGDQWWFKENLNIGIMIPAEQNSTNNGIIEKYCYNNEEIYCDIYGGLYQWDELMSYGTISGIQGICPSGWHIPTNTDWWILINYLGGDIVAGGKLKEEGTIHWRAPNTGATNSSCFTALPTTTRFLNNSFNPLDYQSWLWSSFQINETMAQYWMLYYNREDILLVDYGYYKWAGAASRCIKD
jgi:uncharacterized protein (TIGR02145 family)